MAQVRKAFVWLLAHGQWKLIEDVIPWGNCEDVRNKAVRDKFLSPFGYDTGEGWQIGQQSGPLAYQVYVYGKYVMGGDEAWERDSKDEIAYLVSINTVKTWQCFYAQTLPDMLQILALLAPIIQAHAALSTTHMLKQNILPALQLANNVLPLQPDEDEEDKDEDDEDDEHEKD